MTIDIVNVERTPFRDSFTVTGKVGPKQRAVEVTNETIRRRLAELTDGKMPRDYQLRDLAPLIAQLATPALAEAFKS